MTTHSKVPKAPAKQTLAKEAAGKKPVRKKECARCTVPKKKGSRTVKVLVDKMLGEIEAKLHGDQIKPTVGDYLRLLQYREEMQSSDQPKEIKVTWVDPEVKTSESEQ